MSILTNRFTVHFPDDFDDRAEFEMPSRGYVTGIVVELSDGSRHPLSLFDLSRLSHEAQADFRDGYPCFAEPGLVVLPEVTPGAIQRAVERLVDEGFFRLLTPTSPSPSA